jgi:hypothetical protein
MGDQDDMLFILYGEEIQLQSMLQKKSQHVSQMDEVIEDMRTLMLRST